jgi:hypothetical protein
VSARFGKGLLAHTPSKIAHRLAAVYHPKISAALAAGPKGAADLSAFRPPRMNQRYTSTCHAHSRAAGLYSAWGAAGRPLLFVPSPVLVASCTYLDVRSAATPPGVALAVLQDVGAELQDSEDATQRWGIAPIQPLSTDPNQYTDVPDNTAVPGTVFPEADPKRLEIAGSSLQAPEYSITPGQAVRPTLQVIAALDSNIPVQTANPVGPAYEALTATQIAMPEPNGDGHAQYTDVYLPMTAAEKAQCGSQGTYKFAIVGSWGLEVCADGIFWVSEEWIDQGWTYFPLTVPEAA